MNTTDPGDENLIATGTSEFARARYSDVTVNKMCANGSTLEEIIVQLVKEKHEIADKALRYQMIAPKKIKMADGSVRIWRCPDDLIPD